MLYSLMDITQIKNRLEQAHLAEFIYQHQPHLLVLQEPLNDAAKALNIFVQHEHSADQIGLQFGLRISDNQTEFLIGITHSDQNREYEIGAGNLKADQKAFNLLYAFYNYPKGFYLIHLPLNANAAQLKSALNAQFFHHEALTFLHTAFKINPMGEQRTWMKDFIVEQSLDMKVRIQTALLQ
ncbi:hypothetical protein CDG60_13170 [Acinetobacter chinensis]|uniref:Uncharacterized protein n=1 Tax=Acinetobacter chinensis TaxID=2004650 RepID=A0A3B7LXC3_9GAMM|nr:hypothetical protein [Acinetobacter chinensis]AXY57432.1 hypothetical protein CDG60_13170 [Acinetobacter chinensis]